MSGTQIAAIIIVVAVVALAVAIGWYGVRRRLLRQRFGPEYDRVVSERSGVLAAERELRARERRHADLTLRELDPTDRERYASSWQDIQARFVDEPDAAVAAADGLVTRLVAERGYPVDSYEGQLADLSVDHGRTLGQYREAHEILVRHERGEAGTEDLRQAMVHYRALFADLLGQDPVPGRARTPDDAR